MVRVSSTFPTSSHRLNGRSGDMIYLELFRRPALVLNSLTAARDLLDKRSAKYSDRPRMVLMCEMYVSQSMPYFIRSPDYPNSPPTSD